MRRAPYIFSILIAFLCNSIAPHAQAQELSLPKPGTMVHLSPVFNPPILKGIKVHPNNPFRFDFILDQGDSPTLDKEGVRGRLKEESTKLIKYFLASLTVPEKDLWVNLSPYEKDRIVPDAFGKTEMGRDLLAQDYMLKQITASLIYPENEIGKKFWKRIYEESAKRFGTTNIPVDTFNKVWIVPEKAVVYENTNAGTAYVVESKLKVMLEEDYLALNKNIVGAGLAPAQNIAQNNRATARVAPTNNINKLGSQIVREVVIPVLTKEINTGKNFAQLRQVYNSLILATWYKKKIKDSIINQVYSNRNKINGVNINDRQDKLKIYDRYLQAFKKGAYNYIKEEIDPVSQKSIPRKYFSGGVSALGLSRDLAIVSALPLVIESQETAQLLIVDMASVADMPNENTLSPNEIDLIRSKIEGTYPDLLSQVVFFARVYFYVKEHMHIDDKNQAHQNKLLDMAYRIVKNGEAKWGSAKKVLFYVINQGFNFSRLEINTKGRLLSIVAGVGKSGDKNFDKFKEVLQGIQDRFSISQNDGMLDGLRQKLLTAAYYISRSQNRESIVEKFFIFINDKFGITKEELKKKKDEGGLELGEKIRLITAAYAVALGKDGLNTFEKAIDVIETRFGIDKEELKKKKDEGGLELGEKIRLITAAYNVALGKDGLNTFEKAIDVIEIEKQVKSLSAEEKIKIIMEIANKINPFALMGNDMAMLFDSIPDVDVLVGVATVGVLSSVDLKGGVDLNLDKALEITRSGQNQIKFNIDLAMLNQFQKNSGFIPVIISSKPIINIRLFLESVT